MLNDWAPKRRCTGNNRPSPGARVNVAVRVRPLSERESKTSSTIRVVDHKYLVFENEAEVEPFYSQGQRACMGLVKPNRPFMFDQVVGLERATAVNGSVKDLIREGTKINLSMVAPSNCIDALSKSGAQRVPYRDSKLTHIMKDFSGGTCGILMIAAVSPSKLS
ncbi:hypothetical protein MRX96_007625 [Rhipicephalus microplus]